jgi:hypothetical protein
MLVSQYPFVFLTVSLALDLIIIITSYTCEMVAFGNNRRGSCLRRIKQYSYIIVGARMPTDNPTYRVNEQNGGLAASLNVPLLPYSID